MTDESLRPMTYLAAADLGRSAFGELAPLSAGVVRVRVSAIVPPATDTE